MTLISKWLLPIEHHIFGIGSKIIGVDFHEALYECLPNLA